MDEVNWDRFLVETPPGKRCVISGGFASQDVTGGEVRVGALLLHCAGCNDKKFFDPITPNFRFHYKVGGSTSSSPMQPNVVDCLLKYKCRDCACKKLIAVLLEGHDNNFNALKFGEHPPFGEMLPGRLISLIGPDRDLFLKGQRCERQGLGIGAYAYYRRVVENQWDRLIARIETAAERLRAPERVTQAIAKAKGKWRFGDAVDSLKDAIPDQLRIDGHNPLILLYRPLSLGLHELSEEECLEQAHSIRLVLAKLAENMAAALADDAELKAAVSKLAASRSDATDNNEVQQK